MLSPLSPLRRRHVQAEQGRGSAVVEYPVSKAGEAPSSRPLLYLLLAGGGAPQRRPLLR
jgi:hypothetical protein